MKLVGWSTRWQVSFGGDDPLYQHIDNFIVRVAQDFFIDILVVLTKAGTNLPDMSRGL